MKPQKSIVLMSVLLCLLMLGNRSARAQAAHAPLAVQLRPAHLTVSPAGGVVAFTGCVQNISQNSLPLFIDAASISSPAGYAVQDWFSDYLLWYSPFGGIEAGKTYKGPLFQIVVPAGAASFGGYFTVYDSTTGQYATAQYTVTVTSTPNSGNRRFK